MVFWQILIIQMNMQIAEKCSQTVDEFDKVVSNSEMNEVYNELL